MSIIQATGGFGGKVVYYEGLEAYEGAGGTPNGRAGATSTTSASK